jgi:hypothetical protein
MAELVRVFHNLSTAEAQQIVDTLVERRIPLIWEGENVRRVLDPKMKLKDQILVLLAISPERVATKDLREWTDVQNAGYFSRVLRELHSARMIELSKDEQHVLILPPGSQKAAEIIHSTL